MAHGATWRTVTAVLLVLYLAFTTWWVYLEDQVTRRLETPGAVRMTYAELCHAGAGGAES